MSGIPNMANMANISRLGSGGGGGVLVNESFTLQATHGTVLSPADSTTYYVGQGVFSNIGANDARIYVQKKCILKKVFLTSRHTVAGSGEQSTIAILVNGTTATTVTATWVDNTANINVGSNTSLGIALNKGDYICLRRVTPAWVTNPTNVGMSAVFRCDCSPASGSGTYILQGGAVATNPADSTTYYLDDSQFTTTATQARIYIPKTGIITSASFFTRITAGSNEQFTIALRLNNTTNTNITTTASWDTTTSLYQNTGLSIAVTEGDYVSFTYTSPSWGTNPTGPSHSFALTVTY